MAFESGRPRQVECCQDRCLASLAESEGGWPDYVLGMLRSTSLSDVTEHALFYREPADCHVYGSGAVTLLGDAAHLTAAALGQVQTLPGICCIPRERSCLVLPRPHHAQEDGNDCTEDWLQRTLSRLLQASPSSGSALAPCAWFDRS